MEFEEAVDELELGGASIESFLLNHIIGMLPLGSTILELGSGYGTKELAKYYTMYSIEHDKYYVDKWESTYLYAPLKEHKPLLKYTQRAVWYDPEILTPQVENLEYDLILIDGPPYSRAGFLKYFSMFNPNVPMIFDDCYRTDEKQLIHDIANILQRPYQLHFPVPKTRRVGRVSNVDSKPFGVIKGVIK